MVESDPSRCWPPAEPRVSVVIPAHDRAGRIGPTLDSALAQSYRDFEVVVVDDGSNDGLASVLAERWPGVRVVRSERQRGVAAARNLGVESARGELIAFLDSDDLWSPDKLALQVADFDGHPDTVLHFTDLTWAREGTAHRASDRCPFDASQPCRALLEGFPLLPSAALLRRSDYQKVGGSDPRFTTASDRELWLRMLPLGPCRFLELPLVRYVASPDALSQRLETREADYGRIRAEFLARLEHAPLRPLERHFEACDLLGTAAVHAEAKRWREAGAALAAALRCHPPVLLRSRAARASLRRIASRFAWEAVRRLLGRRRRDALRRALGGATRGCDISFRPPPPAPRKSEVTAPRSARESTLRASLDLRQPAGFRHGGARRALSSRRRERRGADRGTP